MRARCFELRYRVYVEEMGLQAVGADHQRRRLSDEYDPAAIVYYVASGDDVIATLRSIRAADAIPNGFHALYDLDTAFAEVPPEHMSFSNYLIIDPAWRRSRALGRLLDRNYRTRRSQGVWLDFAQCDPALVTLYETIGYRRFKPSVVDPEYGLSIALVLVGDDVEHLTCIRSPFAKVAADFDNDPAHGQWFARKFAAYAHPSSARTMGIDEFLAYVGERIDVNEPPLLRGLAQDEIDKLIRSTNIVHAKQGDALLRAGAVGKEMFMLLSGAAEVRGGNGKNEVVLQTLGRGQVFGEMAMLRQQPRSSDVVAISDVELLTLNRELFERLAESMPGMVARLLWNLAIILSDRIDLTTGALLAAVGDDGTFNIAR